MFKKFLKLKQKAQVLVYFAVALPFLFMFVGAAADFGWIYFNQSRLQNAADAAVLAGARAIVDTKRGANKTFEINFVSRFPEFSTFVPNNTTAGHAAATAYAEKNFDKSDINDTSDEKPAYYYAMTEYTHGNIETLSTLYYAVELDGKAKHLFSIMENLFGDNMKLKAFAVAKITSNGENITVPAEIVKNIGFYGTVIGNWEIQNNYKNNVSNYNNLAYNNYYADDKNEFLQDKQEHNGYNPVTKTINYSTLNGYRAEFSGEWNYFQDPKAHYRDNDEYRYVKITVQDKKYDTNSIKSSSVGTSPNGNTIHAEDDVHSIDIDFKQDVNFGAAIRGDWDLGMGVQNNATNKEKVPGATQIKPSDYRDNWDANKAFNYRVHAFINFEHPYKKRTESKMLSSYGLSTDTDVSNLRDPLWVRIEGEPIWSYLGFKTIYILNSVYQIIININQSNTANDERPLVMFYDGPETNKENPNLGQSVRDAIKAGRYANVRDSKPVILNLNADFDGILYAPNSPVVVNSNGHNFKGFIIAKSYCELKTAADFRYDEATEKYYDTDDEEVFKVEDEHGNIMFLKTETKIDEPVHGEVQFKNFSTAERTLGTISTLNVSNLNNKQDVEELELYLKNNNLLISRN